MTPKETVSTPANGESNTQINVADTPNINTLTEQIAALERRIGELEDAPAQDIEDRLAMVVFSGDLDKAIASFIIATGAAAMGLEVSMFFTFWGLSIIKKQKKYEGKNLLEKGFTALLPAGTKGLNLSQNNYFGAGAKIIRKLMNDHDVSSIEELVEMAQEFGVRMVACDMSRELLGVADDELMEGMDLGGVATFMADAARAKASLFI